MDVCETPEDGKEMGKAYEECEGIARTCDCEELGKGVICQEGIYEKLLRN